VSGVDARMLRAMFEAIAMDVEAEKDELCRLDGVIGDADHGIAMALGFDAVRKALADPDPAANPTSVFNTAARAFLNAVGASSGPLYATAFMRAGAAVKGKTALGDADVIAMLAAMAQGIRDRGKAERGEKTMVDAWDPAAEAAAAARGDLGARLDAALAAARAGAEATKGMVAGKGRSARLGERARGHMDPGAASAVVVIAAMRRALAP
jgi:phosphoenolpyruvate---glycerone phosphotransferase subunit DhaL